MSRWEGFADLPWDEPATYLCECGRHLPCRHVDDPDHGPGSYDRLPDPDEPSAAPGAPGASSPAGETWREAQEAVERQSRPRPGVGVAADPEEAQ